MIGEVTPDAAGQMLTIGEFARQTRLTAKALRLYDEIGLLRPAGVDPTNGHRRYGAGQVRSARLIAMLRGADVGSAEIGLLLADLGQNRDLATARLDRHLIELEVRHTSRRFLIRHIRAMLREEDQPMFFIHTRHVPAQRVMSIQRRLRAPTDLIGIRTEPAHDEAFTTITKAQWAYPAILAAYDTVACSAEATTRPGSRLSCREVYLTEPEAIGDDELICDIAYPLGVEQQVAAPSC
jgi:DNA-binding transcriptional MerR regulator